MFTACSDFLDEVPKGNITSEGYYKTAQHAISATNAIYDYLIIGYAPNGLWDKNYGGTFYNDAVLRSFEKIAGNRTIAIDPKDKRTMEIIIKNAYVEFANYLDDESQKK